MKIERYIESDVLCRGKSSKGFLHQMDSKFETYNPATNKQETRKHTLEMRTVKAKQQTGREEGEER